MARKSPPTNGHDRLEEAMATLIQNQAALVSSSQEAGRAHAEYERRHLQYKRETAERFARIEAQMAEIIRILNEHVRLLKRLIDAVREKIGFKGKGKRVHSILGQQYGMPPFIASSPSPQPSCR